jgi:hypothetical protein
VKYDDKGKEEYVAEFWAPYPKYPPPSIHLKLNHRVQHDRIPIPMQPLSREWIQDKIRSYFCL